MRSDDDLPPHDVYVPLAFFRELRRKSRKAPKRVKSSAPRVKKPAPSLAYEDVAELAAAADIIGGVAEATVPLLAELHARDRLLKTLLESRQQRLRRGTVDVPVESGPRPTEGNPVTCDVCKKPVYAGDEILSPWGDWIHRGFCHSRAVICRELGGDMKPWWGYFLIPQP
jgi:hypothetical protein